MSLYLSVGYEHVAMNHDSSGISCTNRREYLQGFTAALAVLITRAPQSRQHGPVELLLGRGLRTCYVSGKTGYSTNGFRLEYGTWFSELKREYGNETDVVVPLESVRAISKRFDNMTYVFFLGKQVAYPVVANYDECPKNIGSDVVKNLKKPSQVPRGVLIIYKVRFKPVKQVYRPLSKNKNVNTSGNKKKDVESVKEFSNPNPFDMLNSVENDVDLGTNGGTSNLASKEANSSRSSFWNVRSSTISTNPIAEKVDKLEKIIIDEKITLVDDEGKPLKKMDYPDVLIVRMKLHQLITNWQISGFRGLAMEIPDNMNLYEIIWISSYVVARRNRLIEMCSARYMSFANDSFPLLSVSITHVDPLDPMAVNEDVVLAKLENPPNMEEVVALVYKELIEILDDLSGIQDTSVAPKAENIQAGKKQIIMTNDGVYEEINEEGEREEVLAQRREHLVLILVIKLRLMTRMQLTLEEAPQISYLRGLNASHNIRVMVCWDFDFIVIDETVAVAAGEGSIVPPARRISDGFRPLTKDNMNELAVEHAWKLHVPLDHVEGSSGGYKQELYAGKEN
nr:hypothetical protein [Tanacetum cinerariifolium]